MDKKKVIELIEKGIQYQHKSSHVSSYKVKAKNCFNEALTELKKPDWISVEDELPPYFEKVFVCNKYHTDNIWISHREDESSPRRQDENGFPAWQYSYHKYSITHWRRIDKLEV